MVPTEPPAASDVLVQDCPSFDVFVKDCPSRPALEHITGRWGALTLAALGREPMRFNEVRRAVDGVSDKMLAQTLQALERDGLVHREAQPTNPPHVEYTVTDLGMELAEQLRGIISTLQDRMPQVMRSRDRYDRLHPEQF